MNFKKMITLFELLALTGVMSVGFSTWVIVETQFRYITAPIETENVFNTNEFLIIKNASFSDYNEEGFYLDYLYEEEQTKEYAKIFFDIEVNLKKWRELVDDSSFSKLDFNLSLKPSSYLFTWISNTCSSSYKYKLNGENKEINKESITYIDKYWKDSFTIEYSSFKTSDSLFISADFKINIKNFGDLYNNTQQENFKGFSFDVTASMGGVL